MKIIDAHVHVFKNLQGFRGEGELYPIGGGKARWANGDVVEMIPPHLGEDAFTYETCYKFLKEKDVEKAVLLQGSFYGFANEYVAEAIKTYPDMFIGAGTYDPMSRYAEQIHERLIKELGFKILKFETSSGGGLMSYHHSYKLDEVFLPIAKKCEEQNVVMVLDIGSPGMESFQPEAVRKIAMECPKLKVVICHLLAPTLKDHTTGVFEESMNCLKLDNVYFDLAAVPFNVQPEEYPFLTGLDYIKKAAEIVGTEHLLWGTDIPSVLIKNSYEKLTDYITESGLFLQSDLEKMFYENAMRVYPF